MCLHDPDSCYHCLIFMDTLNTFLLMVLEVFSRENLSFSLTYIGLRSAMHQTGTYTTELHRAMSVGPSASVRDTLAGLVDR